MLPRRRWPCLLAVFGLFYALALRAGPLPEVQLQIGMHLIQAEVAATPESRTLGLMHRTELGKNRGMLFIFDRPEIQAMWMRDTLLPLSVAFIDENGVILNIAEMKPLTDTAHPSVAPARYALEMSAGWFASHGIKAGAVVKRIPR